MADATRAKARQWGGSLSFVLFSEMEVLMSFISKRLLANLTDETPAKAAGNRLICSTYQLLPLPI